MPSPSTARMRVATLSRKYRSWVTSSTAPPKPSSSRSRTFERRQVQVVGRLVEHQEVRALEEEPRQQQPVPLAARERADLHPLHRDGEEQVVEVVAERHASGRRARPAPRSTRPRRPSAPGRATRGPGRSARRAPFARGPPSPCCGGSSPRRTRRKRRLARAVRADDAHPVARLDDERDVAEHLGGPASRRRHVARLEHGVAQPRRRRRAGARERAAGGSAARPSAGGRARCGPGSWCAAPRGRAGARPPPGRSTGRACARLRSASASATSFCSR